jgi:hypothetical protein
LARADACGRSGDRPYRDCAYPPTLRADAMLAQKIAPPERQTTASAAPLAGATTLTGGSYRRKASKQPCNPLRVAQLPTPRQPVSASNAWLSVLPSLHGRAGVRLYGVSFCRSRAAQLPSVRPVRPVSKDAHRSVRGLLQYLKNCSTFKITVTDYQLTTKLN